LFSAEAQESIRVFIDNNQIEFDQPPVIENGRTLVPLRSVFEQLGAEVSWDDDTKTITGTKDGTKVVLKVGNYFATVNGAVVPLEVPAKISNGRTLVPVRFIAESINCAVGWQDSTKTIYITEGENKPTRNLTVHYLDVGQADSILILLPNGQNMLIDGGNRADGNFIVGYIQSLGITKLDYVIATHPHEDHIGGLDSIIQTFDIGAVYMPDVTTTTKTFQDFLTAIQNKGLQIHTAKAGINLIDSNGLKIDILAPVTISNSDLNNDSAVVKLTYLNHSFLFMGDAEKESANQITQDIKADILKVGHHGSDESVTEAFLNRVSPKYAVISVGTNNIYKLPAQSTLDLLNKKEINFYRTDLSGTIIASSDGNTLTIAPQAGNKQAEQLKEVA